MRRWLPTIYVTVAIACHDDGEFEGPALVIEWRSWIVELQILRRTRIVK